jgi:branched-chain amino acid transport system ATP-binding protein/urea transport system ATP-binding protein|tara:strand:+ start:2158 stop:2892 length:735 start_codon:yes stop_codon:yes gene_type:complete
MALLEVKGVCKTFGKLVALDAVNLTVENQQFHGLIGPNGSGKSTLLKSIAGAERPEEGTLSFLGEDISTTPPAIRARRGMSLKFQITSVFNLLSVYDNILLSLQAAHSLLSLAGSRSRQKLHTQVLDTLSEFGIEARADDLAGNLSHGEQQWLEIAMALAPGPRLLLLDEPTAGMSPEERRVTGELLRPIKERCSMLIVEHDLDFIKDLSDVITVFDQGQVLDNGTPEQIENSERVKEVYLTRV